MAHGLRRVSYATCDPGCKQFCFLARQPGGHINKQYCHLFVTKTAEQVRTIYIRFPPLLQFSRFNRTRFRRYGDDTKSPWSAIKRHST